MASQHRRRYVKYLAKILWLVLLLALLGASWHLTPPRPRLAWETGKKLLLVGFAPSGKILVTYQDLCAGPIQLLDVDTGKLQFAFGRDWKQISQIEFSPDGRFLGALNNNEHLVVWEIATGKQQLNRKVGSWPSYRFCPGNKHIIFETWESEGAGSRLVHFWNIDAKCVDATVPGSIYQTTIASDGKGFAQWHWNKEGTARVCVQFWRLGDGPGAATLDRQFDMTFRDITFSSDLGKFVTANWQSEGGESAEIMVWDSLTGRKRAATTWQAPPKMTLQLIHFSPDDKYLIGDIRGAGGAGRKLIRWNVQDGIRQVPTHADWKPANESPDGKLLLIVQPDGAELLDATTLAKCGTLHREGDGLPPSHGSHFGFPRLPHFAFSPDSKMVISTGLAVFPRDQHPMFGWLTSWLGLRRPLFESGVAVARLYDAGKAAEVEAFDRCSQACFSPDGRLIATVHDDGAIRIWDIPARKSVELPLVIALVIWLVSLCLTKLAMRYAKVPGLTFVDSR
jgi:WD40 repeat protein